METKSVTIRIATPNDAQALLAIYEPYVSNTAITFEYEVPSLDEFKRRITNTLQKYPYLVAELGNQIVGYAYASTFKERAAYDWSVETTIYIKQDCHKQGIGRTLYAKLESILRQQHILNMNACISSIKESDEYLTNDSPLFHERLGFKHVGTFHNSGYKFHRWYDMIWMEKMLGEHITPQPPFIPFNKL